MIGCVLGACVLIVLSFQLYGCQVSGALTNGGSEAGGFTIQASADQDVRRALFIKILTDMCLAAEGVEPKVCIDAAIEYSMNSRGAGGELLAFLSGCVQLGFPTAECSAMARQFIPQAPAGDAPPTGSGGINGDAEPP